MQTPSTVTHTCDNTIWIFIFRVNTEAAGSLQRLMITYEATWCNNLISIAVKIQNFMYATLGLLYIRGLLRPRRERQNWLGGNQTIQGRTAAILPIQNLKLHPNFTSVSIICTESYETVEQNVILQKLVLLRRSQEVPGSVLIVEVVYLEWILSYFSLAFVCQCCDGILKYVTSVSIHIFVTSWLALFFPFDSIEHNGIEKAKLNKLRRERIIAWGSIFFKRLSERLAEIDEENASVKYVLSRAAPRSAMWRVTWAGESCDVGPGFCRATVSGNSPHQSLSLLNYYVANKLLDIYTNLYVVHLKSAMLTDWPPIDFLSSLSLSTQLHHWLGPIKIVPSVRLYPSNKSRITERMSMKLYITEFYWNLSVLSNLRCNRTKITNITWSCAWVTYPQCNSINVYEKYFEQNL
jgi:hypothetical protein